MKGVTVRPCGRFTAKPSLEKKASGLRNATSLVVSSVGNYLRSKLLQLVLHR